MRNAGIILIACVLAANVNAGVVFSDDFNDGVLDAEWNVSFDNVTGWTYSEAGTELTVTDITLADGLGSEEWGYVSLSKTLPDMENFSVEFAFSWDSAGVNSAMQNVFVSLLSEDSRFAFGGYHDAWRRVTGEQAAVIGINNEYVYHQGMDSLAHSGSGILSIERADGQIDIFWNDDKILSGADSSVLDEVQINFYKNNWSSSTFGTLSVDYINVVPEPATVFMLGIGGILMIRGRKK